MVPLIWGFPKTRGTIWGGPHNKDYSILGSILGSTLGSPYFGKLPYKDRGFRVKGSLSITMREGWHYSSGGADNEVYKYTSTHNRNSTVDEHTYTQKKKGYGIQNTMSVNFEDIVPGVVITVLR